MLVPTPWSPYVTQVRVPFVFARDEANFICALLLEGNDTAVFYGEHSTVIAPQDNPLSSQKACRGHILCELVQNTEDGGLTFQETRLFDFTRVLRPQCRRPIIQLHPFALPHLVTGSWISPAAAAYMAYDIRFGSYGCGFELTDTRLAGLFGAESVQLDFVSTYDFAITV